MQAPRPVSPMTLLPEPKNDHRPYFHYIGSLTTPPCSEGIDWFVMSQTVKITDKQVGPRRDAALRLPSASIGVPGGLPSEKILLLKRFQAAVSEA